MATWREQINKHDVVLPSALRGLQNGQLPAAVLVDVHDGNGVRIGRLCKVAARAWTAMVAAAKADGVILDATDTYRDLPTQKRLIAERYTDHPTPGSPSSRVCDGKRIYLRKGMATAACAGHSNHGLALALDNEFHGAGLAWLEKHAHEFGFEWEVTTENWHIHYWPGDAVPAAVLAYERKLPTSEEDDMSLRSHLARSDDKKDPRVWLVASDWASKWEVPNPTVLGALTYVNALSPPADRVLVDDQVHVWPAATLAALGGKDS